MMTTINDIADLIRIIREEPAWAEALRSVLLSKELLELPEKFAAFAAETQENFRLVNRRLETLETDVAELKTGQAELRAGQVELRTDVEELKAGQAELRADVEELKAGQAELKAGQEELRADMTELKAGQAELRTSQARMGGDLSRLTGRDYENRAARRAPLMLTNQLKLTSIEVLFTTDKPHLLDDMALEAQIGGVITHEEALELQATDLVLKGQSPEALEFQILAEISVTVQERDLTRAVRRAAILEKASGVSTLPLLIGVTVTDGLDIGDVLFLEVPDIT